MFTSRFVVLSIAAATTIVARVNGSMAMGNARRRRAAAAAAGAATGVSDADPSIRDNDYSSYPVCMWIQQISLSSSVLFGQFETILGHFRQFLAA
jgi:hypothetical protein